MGECSYCGIASFSFLHRFNLGELSLDWRWGWRVGRGEGQGEVLKTNVVAQSFLQLYIPSLLQRFIYFLSCALPFLARSLQNQDLAFVTHPALFSSQARLSLLCCNYDSRILLGLFQY